MQELSASSSLQSLWSSWTILGPDHRFFFAGDTGYCSSFQEIGRRFGPFDLAAIPIGAYMPRCRTDTQITSLCKKVKWHKMRNTLISVGN